MVATVRTQATEKVGVGRGPGTVGALKTKKVEKEQAVTATIRKLGTKFDKVC